MSSKREHYQICVLHKICKDIGDVWCVVEERGLGVVVAVRGNSPVHIGNGGCLD